MGWNVPLAHRPFRAAPEHHTFPFVAWLLGGVTAAWVMLLLGLAGYIVLTYLR